MSKKLYFTLILSLFLLISCGKDNSVNTSTNTNEQNNGVMNNSNVQNNDEYVDTSGVKADGYYEDMANLEQEQKDLIQEGPSDVVAIKERIDGILSEPFTGNSASDYVNYVKDLTEQCRIAIQAFYAVTFPDKYNELMANLEAYVLSVQKEEMSAVIKQGRTSPQDISTFSAKFELWGLLEHLDVVCNSAYSCSFLEGMPYGCKNYDFYNCYH